MPRPMTELAAALSNRKHGMISGYAMGLAIGWAPGLSPVDRGAITCAVFLLAEMLFVRYMRSKPRAKTLEVLVDEARDKAYEMRLKAFRYDAQLAGESEPFEWENK